MLNYLRDAVVYIEADWNNELKKETDYMDNKCEEILENIQIGEYPIICAVKKNNYELVKFLIESGENINIKDEYGRTALMYAVINSDMKIVDLLVKNGANIEIIDFDRRDAMVYSVIAGRGEIIDYFLKNTQL